MTLFVSEIVTAPTALPITVDAADKALAAAVVEEIERGVLWRAIVRQERKIVIDGALPQLLDLEPVASITSITRGTETDAAEVIPADTYSFVSRDPTGTLIAPAPGKNWPAPLRPFGSFTLVYTAGWKVEPESTPGAGDAVNEVPPSVRLMVERAVAFRAGSGLAGFTIGSIKINVADSYETDRIPPEITNIARVYQYRPGLFAARP